jgi:hypothetical protein
VKAQKLSHKVMACQQEQSTRGMEISALWIEHNAGPVRKPQKQIIVHITQSELLMMMRNPNIQRSWGYDVEFEASTRKPGSCGLVEKESSKTVKFNGAGARKDRTSPW